MKATEMSQLEREKKSENISLTCAYNVILKHTTIKQIGIVPKKNLMFDTIEMKSF